MLATTRGPFWIELEPMTGAVLWVHTLAQPSAAALNADRLLLAPIRGDFPGMVLAGTSADPILLHETPLAGMSVDVFVGPVDGLSSVP
jgi:hypothetical protein